MPTHWIHYHDFVEEFAVRKLPRNLTVPHMIEAAKTLAGHSYPQAVWFEIRMRRNGKSELVVEKTLCQ